MCINFCPVCKKIVWPRQRYLKWVWFDNSKKTDLGFAYWNSLDSYEKVVHVDCDEPFHNRGDKRLFTTDMEFFLKACVFMGILGGTQWLSYTFSGPPVPGILLFSVLIIWTTIAIKFP